MASKDVLDVRMFFNPLTSGKIGGRPGGVVERGALSKIWSERGVLRKKLAGARSADL